MESILSDCGVAVASYRAMRYRAVGDGQDSGQRTAREEKDKGEVGDGQQPEFQGRTKSRGLLPTCGGDGSEGRGTELASTVGRVAGWLGSSLFLTPEWRQKTRNQQFTAPMHETAERGGGDEMRCMCKRKRRSRRIVTEARQCRRADDRCKSAPRPGRNAQGSSVNVLVLAVFFWGGRFRGVEVLGRRAA